MPIRAFRNLRPLSATSGNLAGPGYDRKEVFLNGISDNDVD
jgi:hypothetical protein